MAEGRTTVGVEEAVGTALVDCRLASGDDGAVGGAGVGGRAGAAEGDEPLVATCQGLRVPEGGSEEPVRDEPGRVASLPGTPPPIAARLRCGISDSGGSGMAVVVHGASASATAIGV